MRTPTLAALALCLAISPAVAQTPPVVHLDDKGALAAIERTNPDHFRRITAILTAAEDLPCANERFGRVIEAAYDARNGRCQLLLRTSFPAKRTLSFSLDQTNYVATVRVKDDSKLIPAR